MKLHVIYISIGISTLLLNFVLTLHLIRRGPDTVRKRTRDGDEPVIFRLTGNSAEKGATTIAEPYEDTLFL